MLHTRLTPILVLAASALAAGGAMAQPDFSYQPTPVARTAVKADLQAAKSSGEYTTIDSDSYDAYFRPAPRSMMTREQVRSDTAAARARGRAASQEHSSS